MLLQVKRKQWFGIYWWRFRRRAMSNINNQNQNFKPSNKLPTHYYLILLNYKNFSYGNKMNVLQPHHPSGFQELMAENKPSMEDCLGTFIVETRNLLNKDEAWLDNIKIHCTNISATMKSLETQITQLANSIKRQSSGKFPSDTELNPKD